MAQYDLATEDGILAWLQSSEYDESKSVATVERLPEGAAGFVYRATLQDDARASVIVKHAEAYAARVRHWKLDPSRMDVEYEALSYLSSPTMQFDKNIRTPKLLYYDQKDNILVMEDVGDLPSLTGWLQRGVSHQAERTLALHSATFLREFTA